MYLPSHRFPMSLRNEWYLKLRLSGFKDIEDSKGNLKSHDTRTIAFQNRDMIRDFFTELGHYLSQYPEIPDMHRTVLSQYIEGVHIKKIAAIVGRTPRTVGEIIKIYRDRILAGITSRASDNPEIDL